MQTSKREAKAIEKLNELKVFTTGDIKLLLNLNQAQTYNLIKSLKKKNHIEIIKKGLYCLKGIDEMIIAPRIVYPSYISFLSALNYYELTDQFSRKIILTTTKRKKHKNYIFVTLKNERFFGYTKIDNIIIAEKEKALIDSLLLPKYSGGIKTIINCFKADINTKKLYEYAIKINSKSVLRRLGYILEKLNIKFNYKLKLGKGYELLDPAKPKKNNYNKKWLLDVNI